MSSSQTFDLARVPLSFGQARSFELDFTPQRITLGGQSYEPRDRDGTLRLDISRTSTGYAMRLRLGAVLEGPCSRCLEPARLEIEIDARELEQPDAIDEELRSPYVSGTEVDVSRWANDAIILATPQQPLCRPECAGLCPVCGVSLNDADPAEHRHDSGGDPRWAKLRELG